MKAYFSDWYAQSKNEQIPSSRDTYLALGATTLALLISTAVLYLWQGHHVGFHTLNEFGRRMPDWILQWMTTFGDGIFVASLMLLLAYRRAPLLLTVLIGSVIAGLLSHYLKRFFGADRPPAALEEGAFRLVGKAYQTRSFPSGHTITAFLMASVCYCFFVQPWQRVLVVTLAVLAGLSRVWLGVHWPLDVIAGAAIGLGSGLVAVMLAQRWAAKTHAGVTIFTLLLLSITAIVALVEPNDYAQAQVLISLVALVALWQTVKFHVLTPLQLRASTTTLFSRMAPQNWFYLLLAAITLYRLLVILQGHVSLFYDEAYYYHWSLAPDFGYYSKPPMVAWVIAVTTSILGDTVLGIKCGAALLYSATAWVLYRAATMLSGQLAGVFSGLIFLCAPVVGFNSIFITTDAPLLFFWALSLWTFLIATHTNRLSIWLLCGLATGFGMLSKYTMALLPASLFLFLLLDPRARPLLRQPGPWLAAVLAGLLFALNLYWNSQNQWIAFSHTQEISQQAGFTLHPVALLEFLAAQIFVFGPVWAWLLFKEKRQRRLAEGNQNARYPMAYRILTFAALGILIVICLQALTSRAFPNWAAPWIVGASMLLGISLSQRVNGMVWLRRGMIVQILLLSAFYHWPRLLEAVQVTPQRSNNPYQRLAGWDQVAEQLNPHLRANPDARLASDSRDLLAYLGFHARPGELEFARWNPNRENVRDHYDLKMNFADVANPEHDFIFVSKSALAPSVLARFEHVQFLDDITVDVFSDMQRQIYVYKVSGFLGYE